MSNWVLVAGCWRCGAESRVLGVGGMGLNVGAVAGVRRLVWEGGSVE